MVTDYGEGSDAQLTLDTKRLGLPDSFEAVNWENSSEKWTAFNGSLHIPNIAKHDFRLLVIRRVKNHQFVKLGQE